jgi:competence protein ComEA
MRASTASRSPRLSRRPCLAGLRLVLGLLAVGVMALGLRRWSRPVLAPEAAVHEAGAGTVHLPAFRVDLNSAGAGELSLLPGIGEGLAEEIIAERAAHGPFTGIHDLERVRGIGPATVARIAPFVERHDPEPARWHDRDPAPAGG